MDLSNGIQYFSLLDGTGYGDAAVQYIDGFMERGIPIKWTPLVVTPMGLLPGHLAPSPWREELDSGTALRERLCKLIDTNIAPDLLFLHVMPDVYSSVRMSGVPRLGYTVWETTELPDHWPANLYNVDHLIVPCHFNRELFTTENGPPVSVVPHVAREALAVADQTHCDALRRRYALEPETFVFYNISAWSPRKALLETLHAYLLAFTDRDDVCFVLKTDETGDDFLKRVSGSKRPVREMVNEVLAIYPDPPRVVLIDRYIDVADLDALHGIGDCFFSLTHSEGWGIGAFDAATAGNAVAITGWGGQLDFLPEQVASLIDYQLGPVEEFSNWESYRSNQRWARADIDHAISTLQSVFRNQNEAGRRGASLQAHVMKRFTRQPVMDQMMRVIEAM